MMNPDIPDWTQEDKKELSKMFTDMKLSPEERAMFDEDVLRGERPLMMKDKWAIDSIGMNRRIAKGEEVF